MKGTGAKRNVCPGSCVSTGATFPVAPVESAPMRTRYRSRGRRDLMPPPMTVRAKKTAADLDLVAVGG